MLKKNFNVLILVVYLVNILPVNLFSNQELALPSSRVTLENVVKCSQMFLRFEADLPDNEIHPHQDQFSKTELGYKLFKWAKEKSLDIKYAKYDDTPIRKYNNTLYISPKMFGILDKLQDFCPSLLDEIWDYFNGKLLKEDSFFLKVVLVLSEQNNSKISISGRILNWLSSYTFREKNNTRYENEDVWDLAEDIRDRIWGINNRSSEQETNRGLEIEANEQQSKDKEYTAEVPPVGHPRDIAAARGKYTTTFLETRHKKEDLVYVEPAQILNTIKDNDILQVMAMFPAIMNGNPRLFATPLVKYFYSMSEATKQQAHIFFANEYILHVSVEMLSVFVVLYRIFGEEKYKKVLKELLTEHEELEKTLETLKELVEEEYAQQKQLRKKSQEQEDILISQEISAFLNQFKTLSGGTDIDEEAWRNLLRIDSHAYVLQFASEDLKLFLELIPVVETLLNTQEMDLETDTGKLRYEEMWNNLEYFVSVYNGIKPKDREKINREEALLMFFPGIASFFKNEGKVLATCNPNQELADDQPFANYFSAMKGQWIKQVVGRIQNMATLWKVFFCKTQVDSIIIEGPTGRSLNDMLHIDMLTRLREGLGFLWGTFYDIGFVELVFKVKNVILTACEAHMFEEYNANVISAVMDAA